MRKLIILLFLVSLNPVCFSQVYVSPSGNDGNSGASPGQAKKTVKAAIVVCPVGGEIRMLNGDYSETDIIIQKSLTITKASPSDIVTIKGNIPTSSTHTIFFIKANKVTIKDLNLKDLIFNDANAVFIESGDSITIRNCTISNIGWRNYDPIQPASSSSISTSAIKARSGLPSGPITRVFIISNTVFNCSVGYGEGITIDGNVNNFTIDSNIVYNITNPGIDAHGGQIVVGQPFYKAKNGKIRYNLVYNCMGTVDIAAGIYIDGASNCLVEGNILHHNGVGISLGAEVATTEVPGWDTIRNNVIRDNSLFGMIIGSPSNSSPHLIKNIEVLHNTFFKNRTMEPINGVTANIDSSTAFFGGEISFQSVDSITLQGNNIHRRNDRLIWNIQGGNQRVTNCLFKNNNYFRDQELANIAAISITNGSFFNSTISVPGTFLTLAAFQTAYPSQEISTLAQYSLFTDSLNRNLKPLANSPVINSGNSTINPTLSGAMDITGLQRIICNRIDIGAYELNAITPTPVITPAGILSTCSGSPVILTSSAAAGNQWYLNANVIPGANSNTYSASASGSYTVTSIQNGCISSQSQGVNLTVNPIPTSPVISPSSNQSICAGQFVLLSSSATSGNQWYLNGNAISGATSVTYPASTAGIYTIKTTQNSCTSAISNSVSVTVNQVPAAPSISPSGTVSTCSGIAIQFTSSSASGNQWYFNNAVISGATGQAFSTAQPGSYTVKVTNTGCTSNESLATTLSISSNPNAPVITSIGNTTFCEGDSVKLISSILNNNQWYLNGSPILNATGSYYEVKMAGSYTVKQSTNGCSSSFSNIIVVNVLPKPNSPQITLSGTILNASTGFNTYEWLFNGNAISGAINSAYNAGINYGSYSVRGFNAIGCSSLSPVYIYQPVGSFSDSSIIIYGNPVVNTTLKIMIKNFINDKFSGQIYNTIGQSIMNISSLANGLNLIDVSKMPTGLYVIKITTNEGFEKGIKFEILRL